MDKAEARHRVLHTPPSKKKNLLRLTPDSPHSAKGSQKATHQHHIQPRTSGPWLTVIPSDGVDVQFSWLVVRVPQPCRVCTTRQWTTTKHNIQFNTLRLYCHIHMSNISLCWWCDGVRETRVKWKINITLGYSRCFHTPTCGTTRFRWKASRIFPHRYTVTSPKGRIDVFIKILWTT